MRMAISPLLNAIRIGDLGTAKKLLQKQQGRADLPDRGALFWACCRGYLDVVQMLLVQGYSANERTSWQATPICAAVDNNHLDVVRLLIRYGAEVNCHTATGDTPCHLASYRGYGETVILLVDSGADLFVKNNKRQTACDVAVNNGHGSIASYLERLMNERKLNKTNTFPPRTKTSVSMDFNGSHKNGKIVEDKRSNSSEKFENVLVRRASSSMKSLKSEPGLSIRNDGNVLPVWTGGNGLPVENVSESSCDFSDCHSIDYSDIDNSRQWPSYFSSSNMDDWSHLCHTSRSHDCLGSRGSAVPSNMEDNNLSVTGNASPDGFRMTFKNIT